MRLTFFGSADQVLQEVDRHRIVGWEVGSDIHGEEHVDFTLAVELRCEGSCGDLGVLFRHAVDLIHRYFIKFDYISYEFRFRFY